jgi:hypothetical protein
MDFNIGPTMGASSAISHFLILFEPLLKSTNAFPISLIDSNVSLLWKQRKNKELGRACSLARNTLGVEGRAKTPGWN